MPRRGHFTPGNKPVPIVKEAEGPQGSSERVRKILPAIGFDPRTVQLVVSPYTACV